MGLEELRDEIRKKDLEIVRLISERVDLAKQIGMTKFEQGLPIRNVEVEKKVIARYVEEGAKHQLSEGSMTSIARAAIQEAIDAEARLIKPEKGKRIAIIGGAGKMGNWMVNTLCGYGNAVFSIDPAVENGFTMKDCSMADAVIVSVPIHATSDVLRELDGICGEDTLIFDLSSLKTPVIDTLKDMAKRKKVCSIHPMFGPSAPSLFDRTIIVCDCGTRAAVDEAVSLFDDRGGNIRVMDVTEHDEYMSYVLGLTHAVNIALFTVLDRSGFTFKDLQTVASTTFNKGLDANRSVASEDPTLYYEIQHMNGSRERMWRLFCSAVTDLEEASLSDDPEGFRRMMEAGKLYFEKC